MDFSKALQDDILRQINLINQSVASSYKSGYEWGFAEGKVAGLKEAQKIVNEHVAPSK